MGDCPYGPTTYFPTICQQLVKKAQEKPSSLGELLLLSLQTASLMSAGEGVAARILFCS